MSNLCGLSGGVDLSVGQASGIQRSVKSLMSATVIKTILLALISAGGFGPCEQVDAFGAQEPVASNRTASSKPIWQRPGCYQVGHTRTISIPGCVKFNLSTNACRGYCMSFSIPAAEDIGPPGSSSDGFAGDSLIEPAEQLLAGGNSLTNEFASTERAMKRHELVRRKRRLGSLMSMLWSDSNQQQQQQQQQSSAVGFNHHKTSELQSMGGGGESRSPLAGAIGNTADKRDVISVGQCCNMMETEDVTVNLRCGFNETRRLVFKSAKSCECFFCKHV